MPTFEIKNITCKIKCCVKPVTDDDDVDCTQKTPTSCYGKKKKKSGGKKGGEGSIQQGKESGP